eukprot:8672034-Pyramimonas_sp.AAC.1
MDLPPDDDGEDLPLDDDGEDLPRASPNKCPRKDSRGWAQVEIGFLKTCTSPCPFSTPVKHLSSAAQ